MPVQTPPNCDVLCCSICYNVFDGVRFQPVSLVCGHTACRSCLLKLKSKQCPFDQSAINIAAADLPQNMPILKILEVDQQLVAAENERLNKLFEKNDLVEYKKAAEILDSLASYLRRAQSEKGGSVWSPQLSRPLQRKLIVLLCCQLVEPEGRGRALKAIRSLGERSLMELLLLHQNPYHLSSNLWAAVRARGCQFLGPAMQEEVLKLVLLALSEGVKISRKVLVMYIVQTLEKDYPQASKTSVGHVVQLLYRASCFTVIKRDSESSLMQLKEEFRNYEALRREHDAQIVQIAVEAGLRISPDQWSALLYGDQAHKSHMQSIIDRLQTPQSFSQSIQDLLIGLQRTNDPGGLVELRPHYELLAEIDPAQGENVVPAWSLLVDSLVAVKAVLDGQVRFCEKYGGNRNQRENVERTVVAYKFKTSMCRDIGESKTCPRGESCTFAHSLEEMERYRARSRLMGYRSNVSKPNGNGDISADSGHCDGNHSDNDIEFIMDEAGKFGDNEGYVKSPVNSPALQPQAQVRQPMTILQQPHVVVNSAVRQQQQVVLVPSLQPPTTYQPSDEGATAATVVINSPPPNHFGPAPTVMMQWPPAAAIVNTPNGPMTLATAPSGSLPLGTTVRYQVLRHSNAACPPPPPQAAQVLPTAVPVAPTAADYAYYWYPQAGTMQPRGNLYHPGDILHVEVPIGRMVPGQQVAGTPNMNGVGGMTTAIAGGFTTGTAFTEVTQVPANPAAPPFGNYTAFAQADNGAVYFYPSPAEHHAAMLSTPTANQFGVFVAPTLDDVVMFPPAPATADGSGGIANGILCANGNYSVVMDLPDAKKQQQTKPASTIAGVTPSIASDTRNIVCTSASAAYSQTVVSSSSTKSALSSCFPPISVSAASNAMSYLKNKEDADKQSRLVQLEMKKDEIIKRLTSIKKDSLATSKLQQRQHPFFSRAMQDEILSDSKRLRSSSDSEQADNLSTSIATSVLQDDYPINYAAAVRGRQPMTATASLPLSQYNGICDSGYWSSNSTSTAPSPTLTTTSYGKGSQAPSSAPPASGLSSTFGSATGGNLVSKRSTSADSPSTDFYSPWKASSACTASNPNSWSQAKGSLSSCSTAQVPVSAGYYRIRPYIPEEFIDIKHLSDDVLRKELEQLPPTTRRLHYVRVELEAREADLWRSEDDQVIPFSEGGPQVSRYGPISRAGQRMQSSIMTSSPLSAVSAAPSDAVVQVKDILHQPLPTAAVQPTKDQPVASREDVDPSQIVSSIPQVFKVSTSIDPTMVEEKLEKLVEVKSKLACIPLEDGASSAEKEHLKLELELINKEISLIDNQAGEECLLKALKNVNLTIEELQQQE